MTNIYKWNHLEKLDSELSLAFRITGLVNFSKKTRRRLKIKKKLLYIIFIGKTKNWKLYIDEIQICDLFIVQISNK